MLVEVVGSDHREEEGLLLHNEGRRGMLSTEAAPWASLGIPMLNLNSEWARSS